MQRIVATTSSLLLQFHTEEMRANLPKAYYECSFDQIAMRHVLLLAFSLTLASCTPPAEPEISRPNILWIVAEDLGPYISAFGDSTVATPNLDRLAAEGIRYPNLFSPSGVCAPSRAAIATGMYPNRIAAGHMRTGSPNRPDGILEYEAIPPPGTRLHSEHLRMAGYYATNNSKTDYQFRAPATAWDENSNQAHWRGRDPGQPFFAIFNIFVTHESRIWAKADDPMLIDPDQSVPIPPYLPDTPIAVNDIRRMYSNIIEMDRRVGEILGELEADRLLDSTIVFWYTDHGGPLPRQKRMVHDSGIRVPMIMRYPDGRGAGTVDERLISFIDLKPTILSLAGIKPPSNLDGKSFAGGFEGEERRYVHAAGDRFDTVYDGVRAVRDERYKYIRHLDTTRAYYVPVPYRENQPIMQELLRLRDKGRLTFEQALWFRESRPAEELFDTVTDPHEMVNLAGDPELVSRLDELREEADRWMEEINDLGLLPESELVARLWPGGEQPQTDPVTFLATGDRVTLRTATDGASIGYRFSDEGPWAVYHEPIVVPGGGDLQAFAHRIGFLPSGVTTRSAQAPRANL